MKNTHLLKSIFLVFFTVFQIQAQNISGESWTSIKTKGSGTLSCFYYKTPGLVYEENGKMEGVCIDIMGEFKQYVKTKYQVELTFNFLKRVNNFSSFINQIKVGTDVMGVCNTSITAERAQYLSFSPAYMNNPSVLLSNNTSEKITDLSQLSSVFKGYKAVIIKGSTHEKYLMKIKEQYFPDLVIEMVNSGPEVVAKLKSTQNYITLIDFTEYYDIIKNRLNITRHNIDLDELQDELAFIFPKGSDWEEIWKEFLTDEYKQSIAYKKIIADNLGASFVKLIR